MEIDILTNDNKKEINKDKTEEDFFTLVSDIQKSNSVKDPKNLELTSDMKMFKVESTINSLRESISGTLFLEHDFLKKLVNDYIPVLVEGTLSEIKQIWDRLDVALEKVTDSVISIFPNKKTKDRIKEILENIDNFSKTDSVDKENLVHEDKIKLEKGKRKENAYKNYLNNYLKKYVSILSTGKLQNMDSEYSFDDFTFLKDFTKKKHRNVFKKMKDITKHLSKFNCIYGLEVVNDCEGSKLEDSKFTTSNSIKILKLIFMLSLKYILNLEESSDDESDNDESPGLYSDEMSLKIAFVKVILEKIDSDRKEKDKYNSKNNSTEINKKNESQKDRNLYVMQLLDLETRRLRNEQTKAGLVNYADLSKDFEDVLERDEREQQIRSELGPEASDEQVSEELRRREITAYEFSQVETYNVTEGDDEMDI